MQTHQLHRGRLIDHVHLIAQDLDKTRRFYAAVLGAFGRRIEGEGDGYFWSDELFVSLADEHTRGATRVHLAFQANDEATVQRFHARPSPRAAPTTARPGCGRTTRATTAPSSSIPTATTSKPSITARRSARRSRWW